MRSLLSFAFSILLATGPAHALVGASNPPGAAARHTVMVLKQQRGGSAFCSGVVIAPRIVLTAAHCVHRARGVAIYVPGGGAPKLQEATSIVMHPGFVPDAIRKRVRSIDLALVRLASPLPPQLEPVALDGAGAFSVGRRLRIAGFGVRREGVEKSAGQLRSGELLVREPLSSILLWARPATKAGGACTGDSGGPIFSPDVTRVVAITTWARGTGKRRCGELTQGVLVAPQRAWIQSVLAKWGAR